MQDYMSQEQEHDYGGEPTFRLDMQFLRNVLSIILIVAGGALAVWICKAIFDIFDDPGKIEIFNQIIPPGPEVREISIEGKEFVLPSGMFTFMAYFIGVFLLYIAAKIAVGLISAGVKLLQPGIQNLQMRIDSQFRTMEMKMLSGMQKLGSSANEGTGGLKEKIDELTQKLR